MNKSYSKPSTTLQSLRLEGSFMNCSVRGKMAITIEDYNTFDKFDENDSHAISNSEWGIGFEE